jgi:MoxR-like ATPase
VGTTTAAPTFRIIASMNPHDNIGTSPLSMSVRDRLCRLTVDYQDEAAEQRIVALRTTLPAGLRALVADAVAVTRATRTHPDIRHGSSVRGAIDLVHVAGQLAGLRGVGSPSDDGYPAVLLDAMLVALSGRIDLDEVAGRTPEDVLRDLWESRVLTRTAAAAEPT